jgi:hypothetical protein
MKGKGGLHEGRRRARRSGTRNISAKLKGDRDDFQLTENRNHRHAQRWRENRRAGRRAERANVRSIAARIRVGTQVELAREEKNREQENKEQPGAFSTHVLGKTQLRQERLTGQGVRIATGRNSNLFSAFRRDSPTRPTR